MKPTQGQASLVADAAFLSGCASVLFVIHLLVGNGYGFHRDELQFLDDARHLQWGFVAYPPMTAFCGRVAVALLGISPQTFRLPAAIGNAVSLVLGGLIAREIGGRRPAQLLTMTAALPLALAFSSVLQYNTFDLLAWSLMVFFTARLLRTQDDRNWVGVGVGIGLGVLSKYSVAFPVLSLFAAFAALPSQRRHLRSRWVGYGLLTATVLAAPNLIWLATHHFITLRMEHHIHLRDVRLGRAAGYYTDQFKFTLLALPLILLGLVSLLRSDRFRLLSAYFIGPFLLFALVKGRGYYLLPAYPVLYAAGAVALEQLLARYSPFTRLAVRTVVVTALLLDSAAVAWAFLPIWRPRSPGWNWQMKNNNDLADEVGWPEVVAQVAAVRDSLPPQDRSRMAVLANNYGEAGALALFGPAYQLPVPISNINSFHARGYGSFAPQTVIVVGSNLEDQLLHFKRCSLAATVHLPYGVQNEESRDHPEILVCHELREFWDEAWSTSQVFG